MKFHFAREEVDIMSKDIALVVMAAGMGSRFGGLKQLEPITDNGKVLLDFSVYDAVEAGFTKVVFVIKHEIEEDFKRLVGDRISKKVKTEYVFQEINDLPEGFSCPADRSKPWGTSHAILCCKDVINEPFAVVNADDFYGKSAFKKMAKVLREDNDDYYMVGYHLVNTITENGSVSRGVCEIENGTLKKITERTKIVDCKYTEDDGVNWTVLPEDTIVSMNLWGFKTDIFKYLEEGFKEFLREKINVPKSEFLLPFTVAQLIESGTKQVKVLSSEDKWYGVTYKEDKPDVVAAINGMIDAGMYNGI